MLQKGGGECFAGRPFGDVSSKSFNLEVGVCFASFMLLCRGRLETIGNG